MKTSNRILICVVIFMAIIIIAGALPIHGEQRIYDTVVRLHVLANSDSEDDQALKLEVRDSILDTVGEATRECRTQDEAAEAIRALMPELEERAERTVRERGFDYDVSLELSEEYYQTREYESCAFPAGEYLSLRVRIGKAEGQNWWCCLFPPLCLSAASSEARESNEDAFISVGFTPDQYKIITDSDEGKYKIRFKVLEAVQKFFD